VLPGRVDAERNDLHDRRHLDRLNAFSDGVFAIAITLLVLSIEVPAGNGKSLGDDLRDLGPDITAYFIGFAVIGLFWFGHSTMFSYLSRTSGRLTLVNLVLLAMISLMPFTTSVLGSFGDEPLGTALYAANVGLAALFDSLLDVVALRERLYEPGAEPDPLMVTVQGLLRPLIFLVSIPLAFISVEAAQLSWFLLFVSPAISRRLIGRRSPA
jgi:uncharacterized membrane protein